MATITSILAEVREGLPGAADRLFDHTYDDLRAVAQQMLRGHPHGVLQPTALINSAYQRLAEREGISANDRKHLFFLLGRAMHDVLVEQVRADMAIKRGGGSRRVPMIELTTDNDTRQVELLDLQAALVELDSVDSEAARIIKLKVYSGLSLEEVAESAGITFSVARRNWEYGKAWLHERLTRTLPARQENTHKPRT